MSCERCGREYCDPQSFIADEAECYRLGYERLKAELESVHEAWRQSIDSGNAGWKALAAAEQRNTALEGALREAVKEKDEMEIWLDLADEAPSMPQRCPRCGMAPDPHGRCMCASNPRAG